MGLFTRAQARACGYSAKQIRARTRSGAWQVGRRGAPRLARLVRLAASGARSAAERGLLGLLTGAGIDGWAANVPVSDGRDLIGIADVVFEQIKLVIEVDGWAFHTTADRFRRDRERQNRLILAGWTILRFTWRDLTERPGYVIATIRATVGRLSGDLGGR